MAFKVAIRFLCSYCNVASFEVERTVSDSLALAGIQHDLAMWARGGASSPGWRHSHGSSGRGCYLLCPAHARYLPDDKHGLTWDLSYYDEEDARRARDRESDKERDAAWGAVWRAFGGSL